MKRSCVATADYDWRTCEQFRSDIKIQIKALHNNGEDESGIGVTFRFAPNKHVSTKSWSTTERELLTRCGNSLSRLKVRQFSTVTNEHINTVNNPSCCDILDVCGTYDMKGSAVTK